MIALQLCLKLIQKIFLLTALDISKLPADNMNNEGLLVLNVGKPSVAAS